MLGLWITILLSLVHHGTSLFDVPASRAGMLSDALNNHHLVMIGDSLMRYQYLSLVYYVNTGTWPEMIPNICREGDFRKLPQSWLSERGLQLEHQGWPAYYMELPKLFSGHERCDCHRSVVENRLYRNEERNISISFFLKYNDPVPGHYFNGSIPSTLTLDEYNALKRTPDWKYSIPELLEHLISGTMPYDGLSRPTMILYNEDIWNGDWRTHIKVLADAVRGRNVMGMWKIGTRAAIMTRTQYAKYVQNVAAQKDYASEVGLDVFDSFDATRKLGVTAIVDDNVDFFHFGKWPTVSPDMNSHHWDMYHLQPWVNTIVNTAFLRGVMLAGQQGEDSRWDHLKPSSHGHARMRTKINQIITKMKNPPL